MFLSKSFYFQLNKLKLTITQIYIIKQYSLQFSIESFQMSAKSVIQKLQDSQLIRLFLEFVQTYHLQYQKTSKQISYKCYQATWILVNYKANGYGRTQSEAYKHALRNLLQILIEQPTYTEFFVQSLTNFNQNNRTSIKKQPLNQSNSNYAKKIINSKTQGYQQQQKQNKQKIESHSKLYESYSKLNQKSQSKFGTKLQNFHTKTTDFKLGYCTSNNENEKRQKDERKSITNNTQSKFPTSEYGSKFEGLNCNESNSEQLRRAMKKLTQLEQYLCHVTKQNQVKLFHQIFSFQKRNLMIQINRNKYKNKEALLIKLYFSKIQKTNRIFIYNLLMLNYLLLQIKNLQFQNLNFKFFPIITKKPKNLSINLFQQLIIKKDNQALKNLSAETIQQLQNLFLVLVFISYKALLIIDALQFLFLQLIFFFSTTIYNFQLNFNKPYILRHSFCEKNMFYEDIDQQNLSIIFSIDLKINGKILTLNVKQNESLEDLLQKYRIGNKQNNQKYQKLKQKIKENIKNQIDIKLKNDNKDLARKLQIFLQNQLKYSKKQQDKQTQIQIKQSQQTPLKKFFTNSEKAYSQNKIKRIEKILIKNNQKSEAISVLRELVGQTVQYNKKLKKTNQGNGQKLRSNRKVDNDLVKAYETIIKKSKDKTMRQMAQNTLKQLKGQGYISQVTETRNIEDRKINNNENDRNWKKEEMGKRENGSKCKQKERNKKDLVAFQVQIENDQQKNYIQGKQCVGEKQEVNEYISIKDESSLIKKSRGYSYNTSLDNQNQNSLDLLYPYQNQPNRYEKLQHSNVTPYHYLDSNNQQPLRNNYQFLNSNHFLSRSNFPKKYQYLLD